MAAEFRATFPATPIYVALGNNDTPCGDYWLDAGSDFLAQAGRILAESLPSSQQQDAIQQFATGGYLSIAMAAPMRQIQLIVVNDLFLSRRYTTCGDMPNLTAANAEMDADQGAPYNITTGTDNNGDCEFNDRFSYASASIQALACTVRL